MSAHQWIHTVESTPATPLLLKRYQYEQLTKAIIEIQATISNMDGADGEAESIIDQIKDDPTTILPDGTEAWQVLTWNGTAWIAGYVRATA